MLGGAKHVVPHKNCGTKTSVKQISKEMNAVYNSMKMLMMIVQTLPQFMRNVVMFADNDLNLFSGIISHETLSRAMRRTDNAEMSLLYNSTYLMTHASVINRSVIWLTKSNNRLTIVRNLFRHCELFDGTVSELALLHADKRLSASARLHNKLGETLEILHRSSKAVRYHLHNLEFCLTTTSSAPPRLPSNVGLSYGDRRRLAARLKDAVPLPHQQREYIRKLNSSEPVTSSKIYTHTIRRQILESLVVYMNHILKS